MRLLAMVAALCLAACTPAPASDPAPAIPPVEAPPVAPPTDDAAACTAKGGSWQPVCRMQQPACVMTFADAGKTCSDGDDCQGDCLARPDAEFAPDGAATTGICAANDDPCGCKQKIEDGKAAAAICVD
jgi:hypothetical protein